MAVCWLSARICSLLPRLFVLARHSSLFLYRLFVLSRHRFPFLATRHCFSQSMVGHVADGLPLTHPSYFWSLR
jgi:hypothetical protein